MISKARYGLALSFAALALAGCGGDSDSSNQPPPLSEAPAPKPTPAPTPSPTPTPSAVTLTTLGLTGGGLGDFSRLEDAASYQAIISDNQTPNAVKFEDFNFDSSENITLTSSSILRYSKHFSSSQFKGTPKVPFNAVNEDLSSNPLRYLFWDVYSRDNASRAELVIPNLEEVRKTSVDADLTGNVPEHVMLAEIRFPEPKYLKSFQLIGSRTSASQLPTAGARTMVGEAFGSRYPMNVNGPWVYIGDSVLKIDFATRKITGTIVVEQFLTGYASKMHCTLSGDLLPDGSFSGDVVVQGSSVIESGQFVGALYGSLADEIGIILHTSGASGTNLLGLVAGME